MLVLEIVFEHAARILNLSYSESFVTITLDKKWLIDLGAKTTRERFMRNTNQSNSHIHLKATRTISKLRI